MIHTELLATIALSAAFMCVGCEDCFQVRTGSEGAGGKAPSPMEAPQRPPMPNPSGGQPAAGAPAPPSPAPASYPIDLATALRLAGANNLQIQFTRHRLQASLARLEGAQAMWLPSISAGPEYAKHDGRIQATEGQIIDASKSAAFFGGGPSMAFDLGDAIFEPLVARQTVRADQASIERTVNDTLLEVTLAYFGLVEAEQLRVIAEEDVRNAAELVGLTEGFARTGQGLESDASRARSELASRERERVAVEESILTASVRLAALLRLDPMVTLHATEERAAPLVFIAEGSHLGDLIGQALASRPETEEREALVRESQELLQRERYRPLIPNLRIDFVAGAFGGGEGSQFDDFGGQSDFTASAVWELRNLGFGNRSAVRRREAEMLQARTLAEETHDRIASEVVTAFHQVEKRRPAIDAARKMVEEAVRSQELNLQRIRGVQGLPIEALEANRSVAGARRAYLASVMDYNRSQALLMRALGQRIRPSDDFPH